MHVSSHDHISFWICAWSHELRPPKNDKTNDTNIERSLSQETTETESGSKDNRDKDTRARPREKYKQKTLSFLLSSMPEDSQLIILTMMFHCSPRLAKPNWCSSQEDDKRTTRRVIRRSDAQVRFHYVLPTTDVLLPVFFSHRIDSRQHTNQNQWHRSLFGFLFVVCQWWAANAVLWAKMVVQMASCFLWSGRVSCAQSSLADFPKLGPKKTVCSEWPETKKTILGRQTGTHTHTFTHTHSHTHIHTHTNTHTQQMDIAQRLEKSPPARNWATKWEAPGCAIMNWIFSGVYFFN